MMYPSLSMIGIDFASRQLNSRLLLMNPAFLQRVTMCRSRPALCRPAALDGSFFCREHPEHLSKLWQHDKKATTNTYKYWCWHHVKVFFHVHPSFIYIQLVPSVPIIESWFFSCKEHPIHKEIGAPYPCDKRCANLGSRNSLRIKHG